jgi:hypothetical protein
MNPVNSQTLGHNALFDLHDFNFTIVFSTKPSSIWSYDKDLYALLLFVQNNIQWVYQLQEQRYITFFAFLE